MPLVIHPHNWQFGWALILVGFLAGAAIGLGFHKPDFLGGYDSLRRRMVRLGHIALVALGGLNVLFSIATPANHSTQIAEVAFITGAVAMPAVCFLTAWKVNFRKIFFFPVICLVWGILLVLSGGLP